MHITLTHPDSCLLFHMIEFKARNHHRVIVFDFESQRLFPNPRHRMLADPIMDVLHIPPAKLHIGNHRLDKPKLRRLRRVSLGGFDVSTFVLGFSMGRLCFAVPSIRQ
jgi:hypothetical protein